MRGRKPSGPEYVQRLEGSAKAKERAEVVLATLAGKLSVQEACRRLGVGEAYFNRLRLRFLRGGLPALEDRPAGRRPRPVSAAEQQIGELQTALGEARLALQAAQLREEIALVMPQLLTKPVGAEKKNAPATAVTNVAVVTASGGCQPGASGGCQEASGGYQPEASGGCQPPGFTTPAVQIFTAAHLERLERIAQRGSEPAPGSTKEGSQRGFAAQQVLRELEQSVRQGLVDFCQEARAQGLSQAMAAAWMTMAPRTLRFWQQASRTGTWQVRPRGRPPLVAPAAQLQEVVGLLHRLGPATGLAVLAGEFPSLARAELQDLLRCYRQAWQGQHPRQLHVLHWQAPGRVWAMDHAEAPCDIDGCYGYVLAVRDLASGQQLLWLPVPEATAECTVEVLAWLFACLGAPLVLQSDNGSPFTAEHTRKFLEAFGVWQLFSPPRTPAYNGSCEAAIGSMKKRTAYEAERNGHAQAWTRDDLENAREHANTTARPCGPRGATPAEAWQQRTPLRATERQAFAQTVERLQPEVRQQRGWPRDEKLDRRQEAALQREVLRRALVEHGYLWFTRRRIPVPIRSTRAAKIT